MSEQREDEPTVIANKFAKPMVYSTSTLLNEISTLRTKLKDLEDDNRSTVSSVFDIDAAASIMRKELYRIEQEKADQEKQFMNQIASIAAENGAAMEALWIKLKESEEANHVLSARIAEMEDQDKSKDYMDLLEEECKQHALELEKMQENIVQADLEVMEQRQEMDALHERLVEAEAEKELLQNELTQLRSDRRREQPSGQLAVLKSKLERSEQQVVLQKQTIDDLRHEAKRKDEELVELNDELTKVEEHKDMLLSEVSDLRKQLQTKGSTKRRETGETNSNLSSDERQKLEEAVTQLEERLQRLLAERDKKIEHLHHALSDERKKNKELKKLVKKNSQEQRDDRHEKQVGGELHDLDAELKLLRNENKTLQDEINALRNAPGVIQKLPVPVHSPKPNSRSFSPPRSTTPPSSGVLGKHSPKKGAISGLVASFERRIAAPKSPVNITSVTEEETAQTVKATTDLPPRAGVMVSELQEQLGSETQQVDDLRRELEEVTDELLTTRADYRQKSQELNNEIERLQSRCRDLEGAKPLTGQNERAKTEQLENLRAESNQLRARVRDLEFERDELKNKLFEQIQNSDRRGDEAKKEIEQLRGDLVSQQAKIRQEEANEEELVRLREQVKTLQPELQEALAKIEQLENVIADLRQALATSSSNDNAQIKELRKLVSELSLEKAQIEVQSSNRIKELESEIEVIELAAEEELEEKQSHIDKLQKTIDAQKSDVQRLEDEQAHMRCSMNEISASRKNEIEELRDQLMDTSTRASAQQCEIESLKLKLEEKSRDEEAQSMQRNRINELEEELQALKRSIQGPSPTDVEPLKKENTKLRDSIREIQKERRSLHERLDSILTDKSASKSAQILRERNANLKTEVENLTQRLKKMEDSLKRFVI